MNRSKRDKGRLPDFVPLFKATMKTPAWIAMSHGAKMLYVALKWRHNTNLQNAVFLSARTAAKELGSNKDCITRWHKELQHYGFTVVVTPGHLGVEGHGKAPHLRLTDCLYLGKPPTRDFQRWNGTKFRYEKKQNPVPKSGDTVSAKMGTVVSPKVGTVPHPIVPKSGDIRKGMPVPKTRDITSLTTPLLKNGHLKRRRCGGRRGCGRGAEREQST
jgi:hypothetical protein